MIGRQEHGTATRAWDVLVQRSSSQWHHFLISSKSDCILGTCGLCSQSLSTTLLEFLQLVGHQRRSPPNSSNFLHNYHRCLALPAAKRSLCPLRNPRGHLHSRKTHHDPKGDLCPWPWSLGQYYWDDDLFLIPEINSRQGEWAFACHRSTSASGQ